MIAREIIREGFREGNLIPIGRDPTDAEVSEALPRLNNLINRLMGFEIGESLMDWPVPPPQRTAGVSANYPFGPMRNDLPADVWPYPPANVRLVASNVSETTVWLQQRPNDGARVNFIDIGMSAALTIEGNGRLIEGAEFVRLDVGSGARKWFYRADLGSWQRLEPLTLDSESPLPDEFDDLLITGLCIRLSPRQGTALGEGTVAIYREMLAKLKARYRQMTPALGNAADIPPTPQSYSLWPFSQ